MKLVEDYTDFTIHRYSEIIWHHTQETFLKCIYEKNKDMLDLFWWNDASSRMFEETQLQEINETKKKTIFIVVSTFDM